MVSTLCLLDLKPIRSLVVSSMCLRSCLDILRFSLDWAVDAENALRASLRSEVLRRVVGRTEVGRTGEGGGRGGLLEFDDNFCLLKQQV